MKMLGGPDPLVPICPSGWIDDDNMEVMQQGSEKKRRLKVEQVRALEKNFEVENKLEPERKARLAQELGLQPRQVAVWFQNRRARWKTKQLEGDYGVLKAKLDALRADYDSLLIHNRSLQAQVKDLQSKLNGNAVERFSSIKEEPVVSESETKVEEEAEAEAEAEEVDEEEEEAIPLIYSKDGPSDSDSSAVLNDQETRNLISFANTSNLASSFSSSPFFNQTQLLKVEEDNDGFFASDEPCSSSFFQYEQAPTMSWYCSGEWQQDIYE